MEEISGSNITLAKQKVSLKLWEYTIHNKKIRVVYPSNYELEVVKKYVIKLFYQGRYDDQFECIGNEAQIIKIDIDFNNLEITTNIKIFYQTSVQNPNEIHVLFNAVEVVFLSQICPNVEFDYTIRYDFVELKDKKLIVIKKLSVLECNLEAILQIIGQNKLDLQKTTFVLRNLEAINKYKVLKYLECKGHFLIQIFNENDNSTKTFVRISNIFDIEYYMNPVSSDKPIQIYSLNIIKKLEAGLINFIFNKNENIIYIDELNQYKNNNNDCHINHNNKEDNDRHQAYVTFKEENNKEKTKNGIKLILNDQITLTRTYRGMEEILESSLANLNEIEDDSDFMYPVPFYH